MKFLRKLKDIKNFYFNQFYANLIIKKILDFTFFRITRAILRNPYKRDMLFKRYFDKSLNIDKIREIFYNKHLFAYSNKINSSQIIECLKINNPIEIKNYIAYADNIIKKEFSIFEKTHCFKDNINWHNSFFDNFVWKFEKSEKMDYYPKNLIVDVRYVWELNRHQYFAYLGIAYYITKEKKYAIEFKNQVLDWIKKNPPFYGINWNSGLEISIRLTSWIFNLYFFQDSEEINSNEFFKEIFVSTFYHAYYLKIFYERKSFNHTVGDLFGIFLFSRIFEDLKTIQKWKFKFLKEFKKQIFLQTRADGTNIEQSVNYHRIVLEFFSLFLILNTNNITKKERDLIERMYNYLLYIIKPDRTFPLIGDSDDGKVLLLTFYEKNPFIDLISLGAILFQRGDLKYILNNISPSSILLLGKKGYDSYINLKTREPDNNVKCFEKAGYVIIRNNWSKKANYLFVDFGRFGPYTAPHSHSSVTNFIFCYKGRNIINDSGTYTYNRSWKDRNLFRGSKAHNILTINLKNQAKIKSLFSWKNKPKIKRITKTNNGKIELICIHNGYKGFLVERKIITNDFLNNLMIKDFVIPLNNFNKNKNFDINIFLHFDNDVKLKQKGNSVVINDELIIEIFSENNFTAKIEKFFYSPHYGVKIESRMLNIHLKKKFNDNEIVKIETKINSIN